MQILISLHSQNRKGEHASSFFPLNKNVLLSVMPNKLQKKTLKVSSYDRFASGLTSQNGIFWEWDANEIWKLPMILLHCTKTAALSFNWCFPEQRKSYLELHDGNEWKQNCSFLGEIFL